MKRLALLVCCSLASCIDFDALEAEVCAARPSACADAGVDAGTVAGVDAGVDGGPPDAGTTSFYCRPCTSSAQCGGPQNFCFAPGVCGIDCAANTSICGPGQRCASVAAPDGGIKGYNCVPLNTLCDGGLRDGG